MMNDYINDILIGMPEIFLCFISLILVIIGSIFKNEAQRLINIIAMISLAISLIFIVQLNELNDIVAFNDFYFVHDFTKIPKILLIFSAITILILYSGERYKKNVGLGSFEFPILTILLVIGVMFMLSANDFLVLYLGLEMQSLALYILIAIDKHNNKSNEAALKYFVLGAIASGFLLYGISLIYGFSGTTNFQILKELFVQPDYQQQGMIGIMVGLIFVIIGFCFKLSAVPFHLWAPDVYEGSSIIATAMLANLSKIGAVGTLLSLLKYPFLDWDMHWQQIIYFCAVASMLVGSLGGLKQLNIKRLIAFSSINHIGFICLGISIGTNDAFASVMQYLMIYVIMSLGLFACLLVMKRQGVYCEKIDDLNGIGGTNKFLAFSLSVIMFSMAGIPPLAGFYAKFYILKIAIIKQYYIGSLIAVISSAIAGFYYIRIVQAIYFKEALEVQFESPRKRTKFVIMVSVFINCLYFLIAY